MKKYENSMDKRKESPLRTVKSFTPLAIQKRQLQKQVEGLLELVNYLSDEQISRLGAAIRSRKNLRKI